MEIWGLEWLGRSMTKKEMHWCSAFSLWLRHCSYTEPCSACPTLIFSASCFRHLHISAKQISRRCKHHESNSINTRRTCFSRWNVQESSALCVAPEQTKLFFQWSAEIYQWLQASGWDGNTGICKLPVIWQLKAIARGDGSGGNQGV